MSKLVVRIIFLTFFTVSYVIVNCQNDPILFSVDDENVPLSEFQYIYEKTNPDNHNYDIGSVTESLDLYTKFKLKVVEARSLGYDTLTSLNQELAGYQEQLAQDYLVDKEVLERLAKEVFERKKTDLKLAQIFIPTNRMVDRKVELTKIYDRLKAGEDFVDLAQEYSEDENSKDHGGVIGWRTAMFPDGFYDLETGAYLLDKGWYSEVITSPVGFHILKLLEKRPARGEIDIQQIMLRNSDEVPSSFNKMKIDSIYALIKAGANFDSLAIRYSQDELTVKSGGLIPRFGINVYSEDFEDQAFALSKNGEVGKPFETSVGWHILKRKNLHQSTNFSEDKKVLKAQIKNRKRFKVAEDQLYRNLADEYKLSFDRVNFVQLLEDMGGDDVWHFKYEMPKNEQELRKKTLFTFSGQSYSEWDFATYLQDNISVRATRMNNPDRVAMITEMAHEYAKSVVFDYERNHLEEKYPDFKALMREYREGILLFEIQKDMVWDKAVQDSVGLANYYTDNKSNFMTPVTYEVEKITIHSQNPKTTKKIMKYLKKNTIEGAQEKYNTSINAIEYSKEEFTANEMSMYGLKPQERYISNAKLDDQGATHFYRVEKIIPSQQMSFNDAKGAVIMEYQNYLERNWISQLRNKHKLVVHEDVLKKIVK